MIIEEEAYLEHYGILRRSGRYPWGSGGNQAARNRSFLQTIDELHQQGLSDVEICRGLKIPSTTQLRAAKAIAKNEQKQANIAMAESLKNKGYSNGAIAARMGLPGESSVRALLAPGARDKADLLTATSNMLKAQVDEKKYLDVGAGVENHIGVSKEKLNTAVVMLMEKGYTVHKVKELQPGTGLQTEIKVLSLPGVTQREVWENRSQIKHITDFSNDGGRTFGKFHDPISIHPDRISIKYKEDGGDKADGVIFVRPGVEDISLGNSRYSQVRIKVGDSHYLKGMAMYKDDLPPGVDLLFNTNKTNTGNKFDAMKPLSSDPQLPFASVVRQILADQGTPNERVTSAMNSVGGKEGAGEEGGWSKWSRNLSSQFLSKQSPSVAKTQLDMTYERRKNEFDEINKLTNPTVRRKLLEDFAEEADSAAVHLKAAAMPRQNWHVILPIESISPTQVYAPGYNNGEVVVLVRYPHGGTFEIPELIVNNRNQEAKRLLGDGADAIGIHHSVAQHLSGADFDGDTVLVIPNGSGKIKVSPALSGLKNFDPVAEYPAYEGMPKLKSERKQQLMGDISNLITDMTLKNASHEELARAVRHSMVVIDAEKHNLNYKLSAERNGIAKLKEAYQGGSRAGAATLISRKKSEEWIPERKPRPQSQGGPINKVTGRREFVETGRTKINQRGEVTIRRVKVKKLAETDDANTLTSTIPTPMERLYANHSNKLKALANESRLAAIRTPPLKYSASAKKTYANEVASLDAKLALTHRNKPLERQAILIANAQVKARRDANPDLGKDTIKKLKFQALEEARARTGARRNEIHITDEEWNAIQAGAVSNYKLADILKRADMDRVRELATPRTKLLMTSSKIDRARSMLSSGFTRAEVAAQLGVSLSTLDNSISG